MEILHTVLLGTVKYIWHGLHSSWSPEQQNLFASRLQSTDISGLRIPEIRAQYMLQYRNNLIGKHFKSLMQVMIFHVHGIATPAQVELIRANGELATLLWTSEISCMDTYIVRCCVSDLIEFELMSWEAGCKTGHR